MRLRRVIVAAVSSAVAACSVLVGVTTTTAHADPEQGQALPAGPGGTPYQVRVSDDVVLATWGASPTTATLYSTPADGSGTWQPVLDPDTSEPVVNPAGVSDGLVVTQRITPVGEVCATQRVLTATTAWTVPAAPTGCAGPVLTGTGHDLVAVPVPGQLPPEGLDPYDYRVYDAAEGPAGGVLDVVPGQHPALDGTWVFTTTPFAVWATDTSGQHARVRAPIPAGCDWGAVVQAVGDPTKSSGYALVRCNEGGSSLPKAQMLVPMDGRAPLLLSMDHWKLGNGFVSLPEYASPGDLRVMDFSGAGNAHVYGVPLNSVGSDSGVPRLAWPTASGLVNAAVLDWLGTTPTKADDSTPPEVTLTSPPAAVPLTQAQNGTPLLFSWSGTDDASGPVVYRVQVRTSSFGTGWRPVAYSPTTLGTSATIVENIASTVCIRVRALDRAGNESDWSQGCARVDTARPTMRFQKDPSHPVVRSLGPLVARFPLQGTDDGPIASYEVQRRSVVAGHAFGEWKSPKDWTAVRGRHVDVAVGAHREVCLRARATDQVGRTSRWGRSWCQTTPYDDRALVAQGAHRVRRDGLLGGGATALGARGSLTLRGVSGKEIWVRARGPITQCPIVSWGGKPFFGNTHPCELSTSSNGQRWYSWRVHHRRHGTVRITSPTYDPLTVDAVAVVR
jgi:hypothetical protein